MGLESATYINDLVTTNPVGASDPRSQGDDHLRLLKSVLKASFPNMTAPGVFDLVAALHAYIKSTGNGAATGPNLRLQALNPALTDGQFAGSLMFEFLSDLGNTRVGGRVKVRVDDVTNATEDTSTIITSMIDGVETDRLVIGPTSVTLDGNPISGFDAGTRMIFQQTAAPTGWTKDTTHDNKALRLVSGTVSTGGSVAFTTAFASKSVTGTNASTTATGTVGGTAITTANLPSHTHTFSDTATSSGVSVNHTHTYSGTTSSGGAHTHTLPLTTTGTGISIVTLDQNDQNVITENITTSSDGTHSHTFSGTTSGISADHTHSVTVSGTTGATGSGTTHTHSFTGTGHTHTFTGDNINLAVQYVDFIIAEKD